MKWNPGTPNIDDEQGKVTLRRLLITKQIYLHALNHSEMTDELDKMIAILNFHNAVETLLKTIMLYHDLRPERELNIDYESMLNEIQKAFRDRGVKLLYRQELRTLCQARNLVQHHAYEPSKASIDEARVFTRKFLQHSYKAFFGLEFEEISQADVIESHLLRDLLKLSQLNITKGDYKRSILITRLAHDFFFRPSMDRSFREFEEISIDLAKNQACETILIDLSSRLMTMEYKLFLVSLGISTIDFNYFQNLTPVIYYSNDDIGIKWDRCSYCYEDASWVLEFLTSVMIKIQRSGEIKSVQPELENFLKKNIDDNANSLINAHQIKEKKEIYYWITAHLGSKFSSIV